ncbi:MAG: ribonuclease P protein component [Micavibrio sp. TMED27]|nr:ribonuclease P protein component [Micavibrio sp.]OUT90372.1 MAG: ribonuclease P protein component [Micavibrio sp. TMED27]|tara:strand:+ start:184 stop:558 length:375 start_codon:yes stop_codon:yes gene_type:complete
MNTSKDKLKTLSQIKKRTDFLHIQGKGKKWVSSSLILQTHLNDLNEKRVGYTVTKRVSKSAVVRNRIKRRLRAVAADILPDIAVSGHDYILVGRHDTLSRPYQSLCKDLRWCLKRLELIEVEKK